MLLLAQQGLQLPQTLQQHPDQLRRHWQLLVLQQQQAQLLFEYRHHQPALQCHHGQPDQALLELNQQV